MLHVSIVTAIKECLEMDAASDFCSVLRMVAFNGQLFWSEAKLVHYLTKHAPGRPTKSRWLDDMLPPLPQLIHRSKAMYFIQNLQYFKQNLFRTGVLLQSRSCSEPGAFHNLCLPEPGPVTSNIWCLEHLSKRIPTFVNQYNQIKILKVSSVGPKPNGFMLASPKIKIRNHLNSYVSPLRRLVDAPRQ